MTIIYNSDNIAGKICRACNEWKPLTQYSRRMERGVSTGDGYQNACKPCRSLAEMKRYRAKGELAKAQLREQYAAHRERRLADMRIYRATNRETILAQKRTHWAANRAKINAERRTKYAANPIRQRIADRAYYAANREQRLAYARAYRAANADKVHRYNRFYYKRYPRKYQESANCRRARKAQAPGSHTESEWEALKAKYNYTCLCCGKREPEI